MANASQLVPIDLLVVSATNARKDTQAGQEDASISGLAQSIGEVGLLNPLTVTRREDGKYEILAGQRRYLACKEAGVREVAVVVREKESQTSAVALSLIENVQRADMHPLDKSQAFHEIATHHDNNLGRVAKATGVSVQTVQRYLALLKLPPELREEVGTEKGAAGVGALSKLARTFDDQADMTEAWNKIGGFTQHIQSEILKRSGGDIDSIPQLVQQAQEGAFDTKFCGTSARDCPHIPDEVRPALLDAIRAVESSQKHPDRPLRDVAAKHKKRR
jgi:ParB/RepB/Spo0J family partition protein